MTGTIPAHRAGIADWHTVERALHLTAHISDAVARPGLSTGEARDLRRWALGELSEIGVRVGGQTSSGHTPTGQYYTRYTGQQAAAPFTRNELAGPEQMLTDLAARARLAREAFAADMLSQGVDHGDLASLRDYYRPDAPTIGAFLDRLIATLCALEARCRDAAAPRPADAAVPDRDLAIRAAVLLATLVLVALRILDTARRDRPRARIEPTAAQAVTLTRAARAPGAVTSA